MGKYTVEISTNNAAFDGSPEQEASRILQKAAQEIEAGAVNLPLRDINGNKVGFLRFDLDDED